MKTTQITAFTLAIALLSSGCATGTYLLTGTRRPPINPEQVMIYQTPPAKFETIGIVNAQSPGRMQRNMDDAVMELKIQAAKIGANGILIGGVNGGSTSVGVSTGSGTVGGTSFTGSGVGLSSSGIQLSGTAIYMGP